MSDLVVDQIIKEYPTPTQPLRVLDGVSFSLSRGESLAIVGPSGSGKSTLLAIVGTLDVPTSGTVQLAGQNPFDLGEDDLAAFRAHHVGFVFQEHHLLPQCTAWENLLVPHLADGRVGEEAQQSARDLLQRVGLGDRLDHRPAELSGGERQRVAIARALVRQPTVLLADEPTGNLDQATADAITQLLVELPSEQNTVLIVVTHSATLANAVQQRRELVSGHLGPFQP